MVNIATFEKVQILRKVPSAQRQKITKVLEFQVHTSIKMKYFRMYALWTSFFFLKKKDNIGFRSLKSFQVNATTA